MYFFSLLFPLSLCSTVCREENFLISFYGDAGQRSSGGRGRGDSHFYEYSRRTETQFMREEAMGTAGCKIAKCIQTPDGRWEKLQFVYFTKDSKNYSDIK